MSTPLGARVFPVCLCGGTHYECVAAFDAPPPGEVHFDFGQQPYARELYRCMDCGHVRSLHDIDLSGLYSGAYVNSTYGEDGMQRAFERIVGLDPAKSDNVGRVARLLEIARGHFGGRVPSILDVGSGLCVFLHRVKQQGGWNCTALDPDPRAIRHAESAAGIPGICADFMSSEAHELGRYDVITFNKVLEHVLDPVAMLAKSRRFLADGGFIYVELPDVAAGTESWAREEFFIDHHHVFSPQSLTLLAQRAGFQVGQLQALREPSNKYTLRAFLTSAT